MQIWIQQMLGWELLQMFVKLSQEILSMLGHRLHFEQQQLRQVGRSKGA